MYISIVLIIIMVFVGAFCSASETSIFSLSKGQLESLNETQSNVDLKRIIRKPRQLIVLLISFNISANIILQNLFSNLFDEYSSRWLNEVLPFVVIVSCSELIPKIVSLRYNQYVAQKVCVVLPYLTRFFSFYTRSAAAVSSVVTNFAFFFTKPNRPVDSDELMSYLNHLSQYDKENNIDYRTTKRLIDAYKSKVHQLMTYRSDVVIIDINNFHKDFTRLKSVNKLTLVCDSNIDKPLGYLDVKGVSNLLRLKKIPKDYSKIDFIRPIYVSENISYSRVLKKFMVQNVVGILVVDEYGTILGEIQQDVFFQQVFSKTNHNKITITSDHQLIFGGKLSVNKVCEHFNIHLKNDREFRTISGWLIDRMQKIPTLGEKHTESNLIFEVIDAGYNKIHTVGIQRKVDEHK
jgi:putative hemolysin